MRKFVKSMMMLALVAALFVGGPSTTLVAQAPPTHAEVIAAEQARDTGAPSRSFFRANCPPDDCPGRLLTKSGAIGMDAPAPVPPPPPAPKSNCSKLVQKVRSGPCPKAPSKAEVQKIMWEVLAEWGWANQTQFNCLDDIIDRESDWNVYAVNPSSLAYGIPQALPGKKMAEAGDDWGWNPRTQLRWQLSYIKNRKAYGTPCAAWSFWQRNGWY